MKLQRIMSIKDYTVRQIMIMKHFDRKTWGQIAKKLDRPVEECVEMTRRYFEEERERREKESREQLERIDAMVEDRKT